MFVKQFCSFCRAGWMDNIAFWKGNDEIIREDARIYVRIETL